MLRSTPSNIFLKIGRRKIKQESCVKFLELLLDSNLTWKSHLTELSKKLAMTAGLFNKICHNTHEDTLILLHHGIFALFLSYGISVRGLTYPTLIDSIFVLQNKSFEIKQNNLI